MSLATAHSRRIVLLHGLGRTPRSMSRLRRVLEGRGHIVLNCGYESRRAEIDSLAIQVAQRVARWEADAPLDFVTHSLGGILLRVAVARGYLSPERVGRVVMLGPPNGGSELVDALTVMPFVGRIFALLTGPAGAQLGTGPASVPPQLPPVEFELGVIAGNRSFNPIFSALLGAENDGKVRVDRTRVAGMRAFLVVPHWHPLLMSARPVITQVVHFLETGVFAP